MSLGLEQAGFDPVLLLDNDVSSANTLHVNRPHWSTETGDLVDFVASERPETLDVDLLAAGLPRLRGAATASRHDDEHERKLFEATAMLSMEVRPRAILIENGRELVEKPEHQGLRDFLHAELEHLGYKLLWQVLDAKDFGVPQLRRHGFMLAMRPTNLARFTWPTPTTPVPSTVGQILADTMLHRGWSKIDAHTWSGRANRPAPTIVGGSPNRGGADLGPRGSRNAWAAMGVNGNSIADEDSNAELENGLFKLTTSQVALIQGFPPTWHIPGKKTAGYRQVGHALPPPLAAAVGDAIAMALAP
jgi:DNA (cytosine-5)-methyltransferase 1